MTIYTTKLRELAQTARPGPWERDICQIDKMWLKGRLQECVTNQDAIVMAVTAEDDATAEFIAAANPSTVLALLDKLDGTESMFLAACADLGAINAELGLDPDDGGAEPILYEVKRLLAIEAAARNLVKVKGRHNSELAMNQLLDTLK